MAKVRVVLADDHQAVIACVRQALGEEFDVVETVEDGNEAVGRSTHSTHGKLLGPAPKFGLVDPVKVTATSTNL